MPTLISMPVRVRSAGAGLKTIDEYIGRVSSGDDKMSMARMRADPGWEEPGQRPEFDEFTLVLKGRLIVFHEGGPLEVSAGQAVIVRAGEWARYTAAEPEGAEYIAVCVPAFAPRLAHRDE